MGIFRFFSDVSLGLAVLVAFAIGVLYWFTKYDNGKSIKDEIQNMEQQKEALGKSIANLEEELKNVEVMMEAIAQFDGEIENFIKYIPRTLTSSTILSYLNEFARVTGVSLEKVNNDAGIQPENFYEKIRIGVTIKGVFTQVLVFLEKLVNLDKIVTVERFRVTQFRKPGKYIQGFSDEINMEMDIYGYRYIGAL